jgi:DNA-binding MurR/RpiR family transcriptional regulator
MLPSSSYSARVAERAAGLAPAERRVATHLLDVGPEASLLSAAALARRLGTSDATVVRTAKALGYRGLADLRQALVTEQPNPAPDERLRRTLDDAPDDDLLGATIHGHLGALDALTRNVTPAEFDDAIAALNASARVVWRGVGPSAHLAQYGRVLTERIGKPSRALVEMGTSFADELLALTPTDAVVLLTYGRVQPHVRVLLERADRLGAPVVIVTDTLQPSLSRTAVATLHSGRGTPGLFASHGTTIVLIEALVLGLAAADRATAEVSLAELNELRAALAGRRIDVDAP